MLSVKMAVVVFLVVTNVHVLCLLDQFGNAVQCSWDFAALSGVGAFSNDLDCAKYLAFENTCKDNDKDQVADFYKTLRDPKMGYKEKCGCSQMSMSIVLGFTCLLIALFHNTGISNMRNV
ncbi:hypothetical protein Ddc_12109 [Ditylenchus destructor]|nr:hypothetical protein Ddc_12109 [Ditylenchus destructor]